MSEAGRQKAASPENQEVFLFPASFAQQRLWFLDRLQPGSCAYNLPMGFHVAGPLNVQALERSFDEIVRRHESLRTTFSLEEDGELQQVVRLHTPFSLAPTSLENRTEAVREIEIRQFLAAEATRPFDLSFGPLFRVSLLRLAEEEHLLVIVAHHIIMDGWSGGILVRELGLLYPAFTGGEPSPLLPLKIQYGDFAAWQRKRLNGEELEKLLAFWRKQAGGAATLELPTDRLRGREQTFEGAERSTLISKPVVDGLKRLAQQSSATLFMVLLAAVDTLLFRYTGQEDITVGSPIAGRTRSELEGLIGFFANTIVLRTDMSGDPSFRQLLMRAREVAMDAYSHEELPLEKLIEELKLPRDLGRNPLFQVLVNLQNTSDELPAIPGLSLSPVRIETQTAKFDLSIGMIERQDGLRVRITYNTHLFDHSTIDRMLGHLEVLLSSILSEPDRRISELLLLPESEQQLLVQGWNSTGRDFYRGSVHEWFEQQAASTPNRIAASCGHQTLTYAELNARANRLAHYLRTRGVGPGVLTGLFVERSLDMLVGLLGVLKAGGAYVPLDPAYPRERVSFILDDAMAPVLLTQKSLLSALPQSAAQVVCLDRDAKAIACESSQNVAPTANATDLAYVLYTSGSTGKPKGVQIEHRNLANFLTSMQREPGIHAEDTLLAVTTLSFDIAGLELYLPLLTGAQIILASREEAADGQRLLELLRSSKPTVMQATPATWRMLIDAGWRGTPELKVLCGGEALPGNLAGQLLPRCAELWNMYGPTETTIWSSVYRVEGELGVTAPIGRPIANTTFYILDAQLRPVPVGVAGDLYIGGEGVARGYYRRAELTAEKFIADPFSSQPQARLYKTGDLAKYLPDGNVQYLGRSDFQVKLRGYRIELGEIESVLGQHAMVLQAVVTVREDTPGDKRLVGYVVAEANQNVNASELRAWLKERLPEYMVPSAIVQLEALPLTPNGKVDRKNLPAPDYTQRLAESEDGTGERTPGEEVIAGIWAEVLRLDQVEVHENFFDLGGHSLLATQVVSRVRQAFQIDLPLRAMFETPTVAALARQVEVLKRQARGFEAPALKPVGRNQPLPLSFSQQRLWFLDKLEPNNPNYNVPYVVRLKGNLEVTALETALNEIVGRHESLRTSFSSVKGEPVQVIVPSLKLSIATTDLSSRAPARREEEAQKLALKDTRRAFDLESGPLVRASLIRLAADDHVFILNTHHTITDGWSLSVLWQELVKLYEANVRGVQAQLPQLPVQYADYAVWQREFLSGQALEKQLAYWKEKLSGVPASLDLPSDRIRPSQQSFHGAKHTLFLPKSLSDKLKVVGRKEGATLFMTLLAGFQVLLSRYSGQEDIVVGSPVAGRTQAELEKLIGLFVNTLVLRSDLSGDPRFGELLARVRHTAMDAYAHQDIPFEKLVEELRPERDLSRNPLFQVMFVLQNVPTSGTKLANLEVDAFPLPAESSKFDLTLAAAETREGLRTTLVYNTDLFDATTIERMLGHFQVLLEAVAEKPELRISQLPMLAQGERHRVLVEFNTTQADFRTGLCIHNLFEQTAKRVPDATALICGDERTNYRELNSRANQIAHSLIKLGVQPDVPVGIFMERNTDLLAGILGILKSGGAYVPLDPSYPRERLLAILEDAKAPIVLTQQSLAGELGTTDAHVICLDSEWPKIAREPKENPATQVKPQNLAYLLFTSGSTGRPKGVAIEHRSTVTLIQWAKTVYTPKELSGVLLSTSVCFDLSVFEMLAPLSVGGKVIMVQNAVFLPSAPAKNEVTLINTVPSAMAELVHMRAVPDSVRTVNLAGEALPETLVQEIYSTTSTKKVYNLYGPTEDTTYSTYTVVRSGEHVMIGRPLPNTQAYILDAHQNPLPIGVPGELYLAGAGLARGYFGRPDLTAERFLKNSFSTNTKDARMYKTGDLCRWRADGNIEYLGRMDYQVKIRGFRIELGEIEAVLSKHASVRQCLVMAREDEPGLKRLVAYVVPSGSAASNEDTLRSHLKKSLPEFMLPSTFVALDSFPLTPNGKVDRKSLPRPEFVQPTGSGVVPPRDELERALVKVWQELLKAESIGVTDNFFDVGGHSLLAVRMMSEIRNLTGKELPLVALFQGATIEYLARLIRGAESVEQAIVRQLQGGSLPPFFAAVLPGVNALGYVRLAKHMGPERPFYSLQGPGPGPRALKRPYRAEEYVQVAADYIQAMRSVQSTGPYYIGGTCEGARIAFEMTRQLEAAGQEVNLLAILDTWALENTQNRNLWRIYYYSQRMKQFWDLSWRAKIASVKRATGNRVYRLAGSKSAPAQSEWIETYWPGEGFVPAQVRSRITVLKIPKQPFYYKRDPLLGWGSRTTSGVDIEIIPNGRHLFLLREPYVREVAAVLSHVLARCSPVPTAPNGAQIVESESAEATVSR
jgi:amino acid adenylation domain-containing protein